MAGEISLADFNRIASGTYNAGQIDIATAKDGSQSLVKVNNHVWHTSRNTVQLAPERVLEVKEAFIAALKDAGVEETVALAAIREELGMPAGLDATEAGASARAGTLVGKRFTPLTREMVRTILDKYANGGRGFTDQSRASVTQKEDEASLKTAFADDATIARRNAANAKAQISGSSAELQSLQDALSFVFDTKLKDISDAGRSPRELQDAVVSLFTQTLLLLPGGARESSPGLTLLGTPAKIAKGADGRLSATFGSGALETTVELGDCAKFVDTLFNRALADSQTLGAATVGELLTKASRSDFQNQIPEDSPSSLARRLAARTLADHAPRDAAGEPVFTADELITGSTYGTETLGQLARRALHGESAEVFDAMGVASFLSGEKPLADTNAARNHAPGLLGEFKELLSQARKLSLGHANQSETFTFCGQQARLDTDKDGMLSVILQKGMNQTTAKLGVNAQAFAERLFGCAVKETDTLGRPAVKDMLLPGLIGPEPAAGDRTSQARKLAATILAEYAALEAPGAPAFTADDLMSGMYETKFLVQMAQKALDGGEGLAEALDALRVVSFFSGDNSLKVLDTPRRRPNELQDGFKGLFAKALQLLSGGAAQADEFTFCGTPAKTAKGPDGNLSVRLGKGSTETTLPLGVDAKALVDGLIDCAVRDTETLGGAAVKELMELVSQGEAPDDGASDGRKGLPRQFATEILAYSAYRAASGGPTFTADELSSKNFDTKVLVHLARRVLDGAATEALDTLDTVSYFAGEKTLKEVDAARRQRVKDDDALRDQREESTDKLRNGFKELFMKTLLLLSDGVDHSDKFTFCGTPAKIVKGPDGNLSIVLGEDAAATTVDLHHSVKGFAEELIRRALGDESEALGTDTVKGLLALVLNRDIANRLRHDDKDSLSRRLAADILAGYAKGPAAFTAAQLVSGDFQTMVLAHMAQKALDGEDVEQFSTLQSLRSYHAKFKQDSAGLSAEMKSLLERVKDIPLFKPPRASCMFDVVETPSSAAPAAVADPAAIARAANGLKLIDIGGVKGIKDFMADLIFSDETMVADVTQKLPGETMRSILSDEKKLFALAQIIADRSIIDNAVSPKIAAVVKKGFGQLIEILDTAFTHAIGESLADAAKKEDFVKRFAEFFMNPSQLSGEALVQFDAILLAMSTEGCEKLQIHVNEVFGVVADEAGVVTSDPYRGKTAGAIAAELKGKTLNQILDAGTMSDAPGQIGLFKQVISTYFTRLSRPADKRSAFAASLRYAETFESGETEEARNAFTGAVLKGSGPILQKMMQGLPKEMMGKFASVLDDMRANLAPIPRKVVQAYLMEMIDESKKAGRDAKTGFPKKPLITSIRVLESLGAASVGEAFRCRFDYTDTDGKNKFKNCVVKIMRHDAEERVVVEGEIFKDAARKIPGMAKTWEGQFQQYLKEFDFRTEARNVQAGEKLYDVRGGKVPALLNDPKLAPEDQADVNCPNVTSMKMSPLVAPQKKVMVAEEVVADGTVDKYFKDMINDIRGSAFEVFEKDPNTGRLLWRDGAPDPVTGVRAKVPVFRQNVSPAAIVNLIKRVTKQSASLRFTAGGLQQVTKAWFHQALLGNGEFHGDLHAGNLMISISREYVSFIDFGNLYKLEDKRPNGPNEKEELLRVILGAGVRKPEFILKGFERLMSPEGKAALADRNVRGKAVKILETVLAKGTFSTNIVYRLQAAVMELQKLGLELPPPINCFILSLARLSNTVTEITTITNQCRVMLETIGAMGPAQSRDELDLVGRDFDRYIKALNDPLAAKDGAGREKERDARVLATAKSLRHDLYGEQYGDDGLDKVEAMFKEGGEYYKKVFKRLKDAANGGEEKVCQEAEKLVGLISQYETQERHYRDRFQGLGLMRDFRMKWHAAQTEAQQDKVIQEFAKTFAATERELQKAIVLDIHATYEDPQSGRLAVEHLPPPDPFAKALMDLIGVRLEELCNPLDKEETLVVKLALAGELGYTGAWALSLFFNGSEKIQAALEKDLAKGSGNTGHKIHIGI